MGNKYGEFNTHFWQRDALNRHERIKVKNAAEGSQKLVLPPTAAEIKESWRVQFKEADKDMSGELSREEAAAIGIDQGTFDALDTDKSGTLSMDEFVVWKKKPLVSSNALMGHPPPESPKMR